MKWFGPIATAVVACACGDADDGQGHWVAYSLYGAGDDFAIVLTDAFVLDPSAPPSASEVKSVKSKPNHSVRATRKGSEVDVEILDGDTVDGKVHCAAISGAFERFVAPVRMSDGTSYDLEFIGRKAACNVPAPSSN